MCKVCHFVDCEVIATSTDWPISIRIGKLKTENTNLVVDSCVFKYVNELQTHNVYFSMNVFALCHIFRNYISSFNLHRFDAVCSQNIEDFRSQSNEYFLIKFWWFSFYRVWLDAKANHRKNAVQSESTATNARRIQSYLFTWRTPQILWRYSISMWQICR